MARAVSRKPSAWNKAVKAAFAKGAKSFKAAVAAAKKSYRKKTSTKKTSTKKTSTKRCPKGSHRSIRGKGVRCVKH